MWTTADELRLMVLRWAPQRAQVVSREGVDISGLGTPRSMYGQPEPIAVKQWAPGRVKELLARFAQ
jgi:hypothetical protein